MKYRKIHNAGYCKKKKKLCRLTMYCVYACSEYACIYRMAEKSVTTISLTSNIICKMNFKHVSTTNEIMNFEINNRHLVFIVCVTYTRYFFRHNKHFNISIFGGK